jgi:hypothetical protein
VDLGEAELGQFVGGYVLSELPQVQAGALPAEVKVELRRGKLVGTAPDAGCITLVPLTPTRFAITENPGLILEFRMDGNRVDKLALEAGGITAAYTPRE